MRHLLCFVLVLPLALVALCLPLIVWLFTASLPDHDGNVAIDGLANEVWITRDRWGIPHIAGESQTDVYSALGFVHAQDRLWQMEMNRRLGAGRLSEIVGSAALPVDRFIRTLGLYRLAEQAFEQLSAEGRAALEAYARGVNAFLDTSDDPLPPEFLILGVKPERWRPADSLVWIKMMALNLSNNWRSELLRMELAQFLTDRQIADLWPRQHGRQPITLDGARRPTSTTSDLAESLLALDLPHREPGAGSNAWVVSGERSGTGAALLANDPHLRLQTPSTWYAVSLQAPGLSVIGGTMPSVPAVVIGRNRFIAWGLTTTGADVQDLFIERVAPGDPNAFLTPHGAEPFGVRHEQIEVRGSEPHTLRIRETRHGPVISDVVGRVADAAAPDEVLSLAWTALREEDRTFDAALGLAAAKDWTSFNSAVSRFDNPVQNVFYADAAGRIGLVMSGEVPVRRSGTGTFPSIGWTGRSGWHGTLPFEEVPRSIDPQTGALLNANNRLVPESYPHLITEHWDSALRARRLGSLLVDETLDVALAQMMQLDRHSTLASDFLPVLLKAAPLDHPQRAVIEALGAWDRQMSKERPEPLIFTAWYRHLQSAVMADELGAAYPSYSGLRSDALFHMVNRAETWCDNITSATKEESCGDVALSALDQTLRELTDRFGSNWRSWRWGEAARVSMPHQPFHHVPLLRRLFDIEIEKGGGESTPDVAHHTWDDPFATVGAASMRMIADLSRPLELQLVLSTGQVGHPLSRHYDDQTALWAAGRYIRLAPGDRRHAAYAHQMSLLPRQPSK